MGASDAEIERAAGESDPATTLALRAPLDGSVMQSHLLPGSAVEPGAPIFTVADLSVIDVVADIPERSLPLVRTGQRARVSIAAFPNMKFNGTVERLRDALNPETRTVRAVIPFRALAAAGAVVLFWSEGGRRARLEIGAGVVGLVVAGLAAMAQPLRQVFPDEFRHRAAAMDW
jgi:multidrug resistance efflux pump